MNVLLRSIQIGIRMGHGGRVGGLGPFFINLTNNGGYYEKV